MQQDPEKGSPAHRIYSVQYGTDYLVQENPYHEKHNFWAFFSLVVLHRLSEPPWRLVTEPARIMLYRPGDHRTNTHYAAIEIRDMYNDLCLAAHASDNAPYPLCLGGAVQNAFLNARAKLVNRYHHHASIQGPEDIEQVLYAVGRSLMYRGIRSPEYHHVIRTI